MTGVGYRDLFLAEWVLLVGLVARELPCSQPLAMWGKPLARAGDFGGTTARV